jgi:hypothetical protein
MNSAAKRQLEFGDYQTPQDLAEALCRLVLQLGIKPKSVLEPTCGVGRFVRAAVHCFERPIVRAFDINDTYVSAARSVLEYAADLVTIEQANFFNTDWPSVISSLPEPLLVIGNPPWVTNSALASVGSDNLPRKSNFQNHGGLDAVTGKSNFDISEYMLIRLSEALQGRNATLAMLCKTSVARKLMAYCWKRDLEMGDCHIFPIDAQETFGASVEASLFVASFNGLGKDRSCIVHTGLDTTSHCKHLGYRDGLLISDLELYDKWKFLRGDTRFTWRSGLKHDCAKIMEFSDDGGRIVNGLGESVDLEDAFLYPLLKSSAVAGSEKSGKRWVLVTQRNVGDDTSEIARLAPKTWRYLEDHADWLDRRASIIYKKRPRFSIFGIGQYSFAPWKVVISGFYKKLEFRVVGPQSGRPVMLDDTAYFLGCEGEYDAQLLAGIFNSEAAKALLSSMVFWDAKRPITVDLLSQISVERLANQLGRSVRAPEWTLR